MNFKKNLEVMIDVTNLLQSYMQLFEILKTELSKVNQYIGKDDTNIEDIRHLEVITQGQIEQLQNEFNKQASNLIHIYDELGMPEKQHIKTAQTQMNDIVSDATKLWNEESKVGGGCKRSRKKNK